MAIALHFIRWRSLFLYSFSPDFETALRARGTGNSPPKPPVHGRARGTAHQTSRERGARGEGTGVKYEWELGTVRL